MKARESCFHIVHISDGWPLSSLFISCLPIAALDMCVGYVRNSNAMRRVYTRTHVSRVFETQNLKSIFSNRTVHCTLSINVQTHHLDSWAECLSGVKACLPAEQLFQANFDQNKAEIWPWQQSSWQLWQGNYIKIEAPDLCWPGPKIVLTEICPKFAKTIYSDSRIQKHSTQWSPSSVWNTSSMRRICTHS